MSRRAKWMTAGLVLVVLAAISYWWWSQRGRSRLAELQLKAAELMPDGGPPPVPVETIEVSMRPRLS